MSRHAIYILSGLVTAFALVTGGALFFTRGTSADSAPATATPAGSPTRSNEADVPAAAVGSPTDTQLDQEVPPPMRHEERERRERHPREREREHHDEDDGDEAS